MKPIRKTLRMRCLNCGHWNKVSVNKIFIEQNTPEPKVKALIPMYKPLEISRCKKCGKVIAEPKELIRIEKVKEPGVLSDFDLRFILTLGVSILAVILSYIDMRRRLKQEREFSQSMANLINTLREELELFRKQSMTSEDIKRQELLAQREQQQWNRMKDIAKAIGWFLEHVEEEEE